MKYWNIGFATFWVMGICFALLSACKKETLQESAQPTASAAIDPADTFAHGTAPALPQGWQPLQVGNGVTLGSKTYTRSGQQYTDFAQLVNLAAGLTIRLRQGSFNIASASVPSPSFGFKNLAPTSAQIQPWYWNTYKTMRSFSMTNLQFF